MDDFKEISKKNPFEKKQQMWALQAGVQQNYSFRNDVNYGIKAEGPPLPTFVVDRPFDPQCKKVPEKELVLTAYPPRLVPEKAACEQTKFDTNLKITKRPTRCLLDLLD